MFEKNSMIYYFEIHLFMYMSKERRLLNKKHVTHTVFFLNPEPLYLESSVWVLLEFRSQTGLSAVHTFMCVCNVFCWWFWAGDRQQQMVLICPVCVRHEGSCGREYQGNSTLVEAKTGDIYTEYIYHPPLNSQTIGASGMQRTEGATRGALRRIHSLQRIYSIFY